MHGGARRLGIKHDGQRHAGNIRQHVFRAAQHHSGRRHADVFHGQRPAAQGRIHNGAQGHTALQQGVGLDHNARRLNVHQLKSPEVGPQIVAAQRHDGDALLDVRQIHGLGQPLLGNGAQQRFRSAQAHRDFADQTVSDHQIGRDAVIIYIHFHLCFQTIAHADHIPHGHGGQHCHQQRKQMRRAPRSAIVLRGFH